MASTGVEPQLLGHGETADVGKRRAGQAPRLLPTPTQLPWPGCGPAAGCSCTTSIPLCWYPAPGPGHPLCWCPAPTLPVTPCSQGHDVQLVHGVSGGFPVDPSTSQAGCWRKGWKTREEAAALLAGNPLLAGLQAVEGRSPGRAGPALPSPKRRGGAGCGEPPKTSGALPAQGTVPKENRENPDSLFHHPPHDTPGRSSLQSNSWPPDPSPPPIATGRGEQSWWSPQHPLTHPQLAGAAGGPGGCRGQLCPPPAPGRTQALPSCPGGRRRGGRRWWQRGGEERAGQAAERAGPGNPAEGEVLFTRHLPALSQGPSTPTSSCAAMA